MHASALTYLSTSTRQRRADDGFPVIRRDLFAEAASGDPRITAALNWRQHERGEAALISDDELMRLLYP